MGNLFGRGGGKDLAKTWLNQMSTPLDMITGQNVYDPELQGQLANTMEKGADMQGRLGAAVLPSALNMMVPGAGAALQVGRNFMPDMGNPSPALYALGGQMGMPGMEGSGPNLYAFNGPDHAEGGMQFNQNAEIEKKETIDPSAKYVYSDRLKVPGTKKTFAEASKKWKGSDKDDDITKRTNKMMLDKLRDSQEQLKQDEYAKAAKSFEKKYGGYIKEQMAKGGYYTPAEAIRDGRQLMSGNVQYGSGLRYGGVDGVYAEGGYYNNMSPNESVNPGFNKFNTDDPLGILGSDQTQSQSTPFKFGKVDIGQSPNDKILNTVDMSQPSQQSPQAAFVAPGREPFNLERGINQAGQYANIGYNLFQSMQPIDYYKAVQNPEYDKAIDLVSGMRYNADPAMREARRTFDQSRDAIQDFAGGSSGVALANIGGAQLRADRAKQDIIAYKQNADNQYKLQESQVRGNLGEQKADELRKEQMFKLQAEAARRRFAGQSADDVTKLSQIKMQELGQKDKDAILAELLKGNFGDLGPMIEALELAQSKQKKKK
jgi:hypothetical protein